MSTSVMKAKKEKVYQITLFNDQKELDAAVKNLQAVVSDRCKCGLSLARKVIYEALKQGQIKPAYQSRYCQVWTSTIEKKAEVVTVQKKQGKGKNAQ